jgi:hypothetical protein
MVALLKNNKGQTVIEYVLLTSMAALTALFILPRFGEFTVATLDLIKSQLGSVTKDGEIGVGEKQPGEPGHPSAPARFKEMHF